MVSLLKKPISLKMKLTVLFTGLAVLGLVSGIIAYLVLNPVHSYVITDGENTLTLTSRLKNADAVLAEAGIVLGSSDSYETSPQEGQTAITVNRAQKVIVKVEGKSRTVQSYGETVQELLDRLGIDYEKPRAVSVPLEDETYNGMAISVDSYKTGKETVVGEAKYKTVFCYDPTLPEGQEELLFPGKNGTAEYTTKAVYKNNVVQSSTVIDTKIIDAPVHQVVAIGTGKKVGEKRSFPLFGDGTIVLETGEYLYYGRKDVFEATGYTSWIDDVTGTTATGTAARYGAVAVDPRVIPYFTKMFIVSKDGVYVYGKASAEDCGGAIKGKIIDLFFNTEAECWQFGRRDIVVYFLTDEPV